MEHLVTDLLKIVFSFLDTNDIFFVSMVCKRWFSLVHERIRVRVTNLVKYCAKNNYLACLDWIRHYFEDWYRSRFPWPHMICSAAASEGHIQVLERNRRGWGSEIYEKVWKACLYNIYC